MLIEVENINELIFVLASSKLTADNIYPNPQII